MQNLNEWCDYLQALESSQWEFKYEPGFQEFSHYHQFILNKKLNFFIEDLAHLPKEKRLPFLRQIASQELKDSERSSMPKDQQETLAQRRFFRKLKWRDIKIDLANDLKIADQDNDLRNMILKIYLRVYIQKIERGPTFRSRLSFSESKWVRIWAAKKLDENRTNTLTPLERQNLCEGELGVIAHHYGYQDSRPLFQRLVTG